MQICEYLFNKLEIFSIYKLRLLSEMIKSAGLSIHKFMIYFGLNLEFNIF